MHASELIELAALVAVHAPALVRSRAAIQQRSHEQYWTASKCRLDRWMRGLKHFSIQVAGKPPSHAPEDSPLRGLVEEILTGEVLTRVWTAAMCAYDRQRGTNEAEPIARSVMIGHMEARHRVLTLLAQGAGLAVEEAFKLNQLRSRTERWTDLLIAYLAAFHDIREFALDPQRAGDFAEDLAYQSRQKGGHLVWPLVLGSLRAAFHSLAPSSPNPDLNTAIAAAILASLPAELFDATGLVQSLWLLRISHAAQDTQGLLEELLAPEPSAAFDAPLPPDSRHRFGAP